MAIKKPTPKAYKWKPIKIRKSSFKMPKLSLKLKKYKFH